MKARQLGIQLTGDPNVDVPRLQGIVTQFYRENIRLACQVRESQNRMAAVLRKEKNAAPHLFPEVMVRWSIELEQFIAVAAGIEQHGEGDTPEGAIIDLQSQITVDAEIGAEKQPDRDADIVIATPEQAAQIGRLSDAVRMPKLRIVRTPKLRIVH